MGKNPSDFWVFSSEEAFQEDLLWAVPNVKASHPEKTPHPCQFPSELAERCVLAFTDEGDTVLDPFVGAGTSVIAAIRHGRFGLGIDGPFIVFDTGIGRVRLAAEGTVGIDAHTVI